MTTQAEALAALAVLDDFFRPQPSPPSAPHPRPGHFVTEDPPYSATVWGTVFGLNYNGTNDTGDLEPDGSDSTGFFIDPSTGKNYVTHVKTLSGASLPREVMLSTFGISDDWRSHGIGNVWATHAKSVQDYVLAYAPTLYIDSGGHTITKVPLVDAGPTASTGAGIDLTYLSAHMLDTLGKALCTYKIVVGEKAIEIKGWKFDTRRVG